MAFGLFEEQWNQQGVDGLKITFYDKGYARLKAGIDRIHTISIILLVVSASVMVMVLILLTFLFIIKNKKRTAIERSLGCKRKECAVSLLSGLLLIVMIGTAVGICGSVWLSGVIVKQNMDTNQGGSFDLTYSSWVNGADKLAEMQVDMSSTNIGVYLMLSLIILATGALIASVGVWHNLQVEPLMLLSSKENL